MTWTRRHSFIASLSIVLLAGLFLAGCAQQRAKEEGREAEEAKRPSITETASLTKAPGIPPQIKRDEPAVVKVKLETKELEGTLMEGDSPVRYRFWTFNGSVPGPFIRMRVGDVMDLEITNADDSTLPHNVDFHAVNGPGGGARVSTVIPGEKKTASFKMLNPGLYVYHCAVPPVPDHVANGMYGLILVEPEDGLPRVDKEFYLMQSEFYTRGAFGQAGLQPYDRQKGLAEEPPYVVWNGKVGSLLDDNALEVKKGEKVRLFVGNGGPNLVWSFHLIGEIFDRVWPEGSTVNPESNVQTTLVPAGGSVIVDFMVEVPGDYTLVDHSIFRIEKGALGILRATGEAEPDIFKGQD